MHTKVQMGTLRLRITAIVTVLALIALLSLTGIGLVTLLGPVLAHGAMVDHAAGTIASTGPGNDFTLRVDHGPTLHFQCQERCHMQLNHIQRHKIEQAHTDVYYIHRPGQMLIAVDVD